MGQANDSSYSPEDAAALTLQLLEHSAEHGVIFLGPDGVVRGSNHGATFITGFAPGDLIGRKAAVLFIPEDRERKLDEHELQTALMVGVAQEERWNVRKDGSRFWYSGVCVPLRDKDGTPTGFMKIFRDRTQLRSRLRSLENALREHGEEINQRDTFLATIAHELRNPLSPVKAATRIIEGLAPPNSRFEQALKVIDRQMAALERLVEDLVDLTRTKTGKFQIVYEQGQLQALIGNAVDSCRAAAVAKNISLNISVPSVPIELEHDTGRMHQVLVNLVNNSVKYTPAGGSIWVTGTTDQTHAMLIVKDNGIGVSAELLPGIFDMFTQAPNADGHRGSGLGIGLALVKQVVELHKGTVEVRSEGEGKGSEFIVRIPQHRPGGQDTQSIV